MSNSEKSTSTIEESIQFCISQYCEDGKDKNDWVRRVCHWLLSIDPYMSKEELNECIASIDDDVLDASFTDKYQKRWRSYSEFELGNNHWQRDYDLGEAIKKAAEAFEEVKSYLPTLDDGTVKTVKPEEQAKTTPDCPPPQFAS